MWAPVISVFAFKKSFRPRIPDLALCKMVVFPWQTLRLAEGIPNLAIYINIYIDLPIWFTNLQNFSNNLAYPQSTVTLPEVMNIHPRLAASSR